MSDAQQTTETTEWIDLSEGEKAPDQPYGAPTPNDEDVVPTYRFELVTGEVLLRRIQEGNIIRADGIRLRVVNVGPAPATFEVSIRRSPNLVMSQTQAVTLAPQTDWGLGFTNPLDGIFAWVRMLTTSATILPTAEFLKSTPQGFVPFLTYTPNDFVAFNLRRLHVPPVIFPDRIWH